MPGDPARCGTADIRTSGAGVHEVERVDHRAPLHPVAPPPDGQEVLGAELVRQLVRGRPAARVLALHERHGGLAGDGGECGGTLPACRVVVEEPAPDDADDLVRGGVRASPPGASAAWPSLKPISVNSSLVLNRLLGITISLQRCSTPLSEGLIANVASR